MVRGMGEKDIYRIIHEAQEKYFKIGSVICPALNFQKVYFNKLGFNHLIKKGRIDRDTKQQIRRLLLIDQSVIVVSNSLSIKTYRKYENIIPNAEFWSLEKYVKGRLIRVIIRKIGINGDLHFFSVMD